MRILFVVPFFHPVRGGMEAHVLYLAKELKNLGHEVEVYTSNLSREAKISQKEEELDGIKIRRFSTWFKLGQFASFFPGVFLAARKSKADIIHIHNFRHPTNFIPLFTKKPCFLTFHWPDYPEGLRLKNMDYFVKFYDKVLARFSLKKYKKICAVSATEVPFIQKSSVEKEKILLTPNAIPKAYLIKQDRRYFRIKHKFKDNDFLVLSLSRLHKSKGFDIVVRLAAKFPHVQFALAGKDEGFKDTLEDLIKELALKNVHLLGELPEEDKLKALSSCDVFIHPSHFEAFGIVVLEAMAQGKPVLASAVGGVPWLVSDAGIIFKDNDLQDLEDKFKRLLYSASLRNQLSEKSSKRAQLFTWDKVTKHLETNYKELL